MGFVGPKYDLSVKKVQGSMTRLGDFSIVRGHLFTTNRHPGTGFELLSKIAHSEQLIWGIVLCLWANLHTLWPFWVKFIWSHWCKAKLVVCCWLKYSSFIYISVSSNSDGFYNEKTQLFVKQFSAFLKRKMSE